MKYSLWLSVALQLFLVYQLADTKRVPDFDQPFSCERFLTTNYSVQGDNAYCAQLAHNDTVGGFINYVNLGGAYCYNNGSGLCKGFAGQFEFYFNVFEDKLIGPVPESTYVGKYGMHSGLPITYNIRGEIVYADRVIDWSREFTKQLDGQQLSLMNIEDFNWCQYTENDFWPYKSSIYDHKSEGRYHIYFFNGQTCIYDNSTGKRQLFNTRFQKPTGFVLDHALNPLIFAMEDNLAKEIRAVKHQATYWYEVGYEVMDLRNVAGKKTNYQVIFDYMQRSPCHMCGKKGAPFSNEAIREWFAKDDLHYCVTDHIDHVHLPHRCGKDEVEWVDDPLPNVEFEKGPLIYSYLMENIRNKQYFINARTSFPLSPDNKTTIKEIVLFHTPDEVSPDDELYPMPMMTTFTSNYKPQEKEGEEFFESNETEMMENVKQWPLMNYVDDIAYLYKCDTILVIFGPLYTELKKEEFNLQTKAPIGSIYDLGARELVHAFYNVPNTNRLVFYHRLNFVAEYEYTCANDQNSLVTARRIGKYHYAYGASAPRHLFERDIRFYSLDGPKTQDFRDESFFQIIGAIKGKLDDPYGSDLINLRSYNDSYHEDSSSKSDPLVTLQWVGIGFMVVFLLPLVGYTCALCLIACRFWYDPESTKAMFRGI